MLVANVIVRAIEVAIAIEGLRIGEIIADIDQASIIVKRLQYSRQVIKYSDWSCSIAFGKAIEEGVSAAVLFAAIVKYLIEILVTAVALVVFLVEAGGQFLSLSDRQRYFHFLVNLS